MLIKVKITSFNRWVAGPWANTEGWRCYAQRVVNGFYMSKCKQIYCHWIVDNQLFKLKILEKKHKWRTGGTYVKESSGMFSRDKKCTRFSLFEEPVVVSSRILQEGGIREVFKLSFIGSIFCGSIFWNILDLFEQITFTLSPISSRLPSVLYEENLFLRCSINKKKLRNFFYRRLQ